MLVLGSGVALLGLALLPPVVMRAYGSAATALLFLAAAALSMSGAQLVFRRFASNVPGFTTAALAIVAVLIAWIGDEDLGHEQLLPPAQATLMKQALPAAAAASAPTAARALYVNAHGGGLRAAVFTAQVLARADDATCGAFGQQVAALSGVSGGSSPWPPFSCATAPPAARTMLRIDAVTAPAALRRITLASGILMRVSSRWTPRDRPGRVRASQCKRRATDAWPRTLPRVHTRRRNARATGSAVRRTRAARTAPARFD